MAKLEIGTKIRVRINGRVGDKASPGASMYNTTVVTQTGNGGWLHYVYLGSDKVTGDKNRAGIVRAEFDAVTVGDYETGQNSTTRVRELTGGRPFGYTHLLYLDSPEITVITDGDPATAPEPAPAPAGSTDEIRRDRVTISSDEVTSRITELERTLRGYNVVRLRNDEVLNSEPFPTFDDAKKFIDKEDYDPARVIARRPEMSDEDAVELGSLRKLQADVTAKTGERPWIVYGEGYFTVRWARGEVSDELDVSFGALEEWPFNLLDWGAVAAERRKSTYPNTYTYRGALFYGVRK